MTPSSPDDRDQGEVWPEAMVFGQGTGRDAGGPILLLAYAYGSPNWTLLGLSGISCFTPRLAGMYVTEGDFTFMDAAQFSPLRYQDPEWTPPNALSPGEGNPLEDALIITPQATG